MTLNFTGNLGNDWTDQLLDEQGALIDTNFTSGGVPGPGTDVFIGLGSNYNDVVIGRSSYRHTREPIEINSLEIQSGYSLTQLAFPFTIHGTLVNYGSFTVAADRRFFVNDVANDGLITVQGGNASNPGTSFQFLPGASSLTGTGNLRLAEGLNKRVSLTGSDLNAVSTLENSSRISGSGTIGYENGGNGFQGGLLVLHNHGIVDANVDGLVLEIASNATNLINATTNDGTLQASGAGTLRLAGTTVVQTAGGVIGAFGDGARVELTNTTVRGGILATSGTGVIELGYSQASTPVTLDGSSSAGILTNTGTVRVGSLGILDVKGTIENTGTIKLAHGDHDAYLDITSPDVTLTGGGKIVLVRTPGTIAQSVIRGDNTSAPTTLHNVDNVISGAGFIGGGFQQYGTVEQRLVLDNQVNGVVRASDAQSLTLVSRDAFTNAGVMESTGTGGLVIAFQHNGVAGNTTINQTSTGIIRAVGAGSHVDLAGATIVGGTLATSGGGVIQTVGTGNVLDGGTSAGRLTNTGRLNVGGGEELNLKGAIRNTGTIELVQTSSTSALLDITSPEVTLTGGGNIVLVKTPNANEAAAIRGDNASAPTILHNVDNVISGAGYIGGYTLYVPEQRLVLDNQANGVVRASDAQPLTLVSRDAFTNAGVMESTGTGGLVIAYQNAGAAGNTTINQAGTGIIRAVGAGSHVDLAGATIAGGTLATSGGGVIQTGGNFQKNVLDGGTSRGAVTNAGDLVIRGYGEVNLRGSIANSGTITLDGAVSTRRSTWTSTATSRSRAAASSGW